MALPKSNRLSLRTSKDLFLDGKKFYSIYFTVIRSTVHDPKTANPGFAVIVSKKTARKAHDRNKIRRLTSAVIYELLNKFPAGNYIVFPKGSVLLSPFITILSDLSILATKL